MEDSRTRRNVFLSWEWQASWWSSFSEQFSLRCLAFEEDGRLVGVVPLCLAKEEPQRLLFGGGPNLSDHLGILCRDGDELPVAEALISWFQSDDCEAHLLDLHFLPQDSASREAIRAAAEAKGLAVTEGPEEVSPYVDIETDFDTYLASRLNKKDRHELRRKLRRLDQEKPGWRTIGQRELGLEGAIDSFMRLLRLSGAHKAEFLTPKVEGFFRQAMGLLEERGWLRIGLLDVDGEQIAATCGFTVDGCWYLYNSGYDPEHSSLSPGLICVAQGVAEAIREGCDRADFLRGDEPYKYHLGASDAELFRLCVSREGGA